MYKRCRPDGAGCAREQGSQTGRVVGRNSSLSGNISAALGELSGPIRAWPMRLRVMAGLLGMVVCAMFAVGYVVHSQSVFLEADARFYLEMVVGDYSQVMQPFASRQLGVLVVAAMVHLLHWTVDRAYSVEGGVSLAFLLGSIYFLMSHTAAPRWMLLAIAAVPFWPGLLQTLVLPDLWYSALLAGLILMVASEMWMAAALMMFPLMLSRESTSLALVCFLVAAWGRLRWRHRVIAVLSAAAGSVVVGRLAARAQPNLEHLPEIVYMFFKVPWNFMLNVVGIVPWSNVNAEYCAVPRWQWTVPFGHVTAIGVCGFSLSGLMQWALAMMTSFGLLPMLMGYLWWRCRGVRTRSVLLRFTLLYGIISLLLAPVLGTWFLRLVGYAWPLFFVALPLLFDEVVNVRLPRGRAVAALGFFGVQLCLNYVPYWWSMPMKLVTDGMLWGTAFGLLRYWFGEDYRPADGCLRQGEEPGIA